MTNEETKEGIFLSHRVIPGCVFGLLILLALMFLFIGATTYTTANGDLSLSSFITGGSFLIIVVILITFQLHCVINYQNLKIYTMYAIMSKPLKPRVWDFKEIEKIEIRTGCTNTVTIHYFLLGAYIKGQSHPVKIYYSGNEEVKKVENYKKWMDNVSRYIPVSILKY